MTVDDDLIELDDILAGVEALDAGQPPPRRKRSMMEFCIALDAGRADGFFLDDFDESDQRQLARSFGMRFRDGSPFTASEAVMPDHGSVSEPDPAPPRVPKPRPPVVQTPAFVEPVAPVPSDPFGGFAFPPLDKLPPFQNVNAAFLDLRIAPITPAAEALVEDLVGRMLDAEERRGARQRKRSARVQHQLRDAVGAIAGNLLRAWAEKPPVAVYRSRQVNSFAAEGVSWRAFLGAMNAMERLRLVLRRRGGRSKDKPSGWSARYWPDLHLLRAAAAHGITPASIRDAFKYQRPKVGRPPKVKEPLRLKAFKWHPNGRAPALPIDFSDPVAATLRAEVVAMNTFAAATRVEGCLPPRWFRQFNGDFRLFGRFCAAGGGNYQSMPAVDRLQCIRIAGEQVVEIDIRASLLSFLHGVLRLPLPEGDLYALPGIPREVAKLWINATLGKGTPVSKWPADSLRASPELHNHAAPAVMKAALTCYPFLATPSHVAEGFRRIADPRRVLIHMLMGAESDVILDTLQALRVEGILGLPMHDGIIVPASAEGRACELLRHAAERVAGVEPRLKVDRPQESLIPA